MNKTLHVLNGDATLRSFKETDIAGEVIIWRDVFSEGPLLTDIHNREFWAERSKWICSTFGGLHHDYQFKVIDEIAPLAEHIHFKEITLWFEFDLHCQVNLLGVLQLLRGIDLENTDLYLICPSAFPGVENFAGIGQLNAEQLSSLYATKIKLNINDIALANQTWQVYTLGDAEKLKLWLNGVNTFGNLTALRPAFKAQLSRLQLNNEGLNYIEATLLQIYNSGNYTRTAIYREFWKTEKIFGMGDAEIDTYIKQLVHKHLLPEALLIN